MHGQQYELHDFTDEAKKVLRCHTSMRYSMTLNYLCELYRGVLLHQTGKTEVILAGCPTKRYRETAEYRRHTGQSMFGRGAKLSAADAQRFIRQLLVDGVFEEVHLQIFY